jgi:putative transposase
MPNHVHLVVIPSCNEGLHLALKAAHGRYAQRINRIKNQTGHFWQGRYFSSPLDADYFLNAVRYVELNPVRAGLVKAAEDFQWSSAAFHCGLRGDLIVKSLGQPRLLAGIANWSRWLADGIADDTLATLRQHGSQNLPCGSPQFISALEQSVGRELRYRPPGRLPEAKGDGHL